MIRILRRPTTKIAFISSFLPRKCGIATFTSDLINNVRSAGTDEFEPTIIAAESGPELEYDNRVKIKIRKDAKYDYVLAADYIYFSDIDIVCLQHEFGLFGGDGGAYLRLLLEKLNKPVVTTLHTILENPAKEYYDSLIDVCRASNKVIVMNKRGVSMLRDIYSVSEEKIRLIPHGVPDLPFIDSSNYKRRLGLAGRKTILTFGLLSKNKGIEVMLQALPEIVKADPSILYIVLGATHPEVLRHDGQAYKNQLDKMVTDLGLEKNVVFHNRFVDDQELFDFLGAADIYVTPYMHKEQLTSGTLAFAVGTGKAVVSTPYWAAEELLADGRGRLVGFGDSEGLAGSIVEILNDNSLFMKMKKRAYEYGRSRTWSRIGQSYWNLFNSQELSITMALKPKIALRNWKMPAYSDRAAYQPV